MGTDPIDEKPEITSDASSTTAESAVDYERDLGVIEAITAVTRSCPSGSVIRAAEQALAAIEAGGADALAQQAYFVLIAIKGWRGDRARQVHRSLSRYLADLEEKKK